MENTAARENGKDMPLKTYEKHLLCDDKGLFPADLKAWEQRVVAAESSRAGFCFWYRNPGRASQDSLGIAYEHEAQVKILRPDFVFFATKPDGTVVADLVDPHGTYLGDSLAKLRGLAKYAETHPTVYRRVEGVAEVNEQLRALDLTDEKVRQAVYTATDAQPLYASDLAVDCP